MKRFSTILLLAIMALGWSGTLLADPIEVNVNYPTGTILRSGASGAKGSWCSVWQSQTLAGGNPAVKITGQNTYNNLTCEADNDILLAEGSGAKSYTYTVAAASGYVITKMEADVVGTTAGNMPTVTVGTATVATTTDVQHVAQNDIFKNSFTITLSSASNNGMAKFTNFRVTILPRSEAGIETRDPFKLSTEEEQHWYYITSQGPGYCAGKVIIAPGAGENLTFGTPAISADRIWSFWAGEGGKVAIKNYKGIYIDQAPDGTGGTTAVSGTLTPKHIYTVANFNEDFTIGDDNGAPLHAQDNGKKIVRWKAEAGGASIWNFAKVDITNHLTAFLGTTDVQQGKVTTGIGNTDVPILRSTINVAGLLGTISITGVKGTITATNLADVTAVRAYMATNARELFIDKDKAMTWREENGTLLAEGTIGPDGKYEISFPATTLSLGPNYLWIAIDISKEAAEGHTVDATISGYTIDGTPRTENNGNPQYAATIFLAESAVLMPMDKGSLYYRIPAITSTADGKRLVTLTDDRLAHNIDLPSHCKVVAQYSDDGGKTWSNPLHVAGTATTGGDYGHGDAQIITDRYTGTIIGIMTSSPHGTGFVASTVDKPMAWKVIKSTDGGETWSTPVDHTASLYAKGSPNPDIEAGFSGSGAGLQKRDGTLVSPFVGRTTGKTNYYYSFISKDGGDSWELYGTPGIKGADEPKVLERNNGDLAISVRRSGYNYHNVTANNGLTWKMATDNTFNSGINGNACDGEYMVWTSTIDGNPWNIVLQTLPYNGDRKNLSIALSTDEGSTFGSPKTICPRGSAYSATTVMADGTLGVYFEENSVFGGFTMRFVRMSLDWASNGAYKFTPEQPFYPVMSHVKAEIPQSGWQTVTLPFEAPVPDGYKAYNATGTLQNQTIDNESRRTLVATPIEGTTLQAHTPYLIHGNAGVCEWYRPIEYWKATSLPANCEMKSGVLQGWYVAGRIAPQADKTAYGTLRANSAHPEAWTFRRIPVGSLSDAIVPFTCSLRLPQADDEYLFPALDSTATSILAPWQQPAAAPAYNLQGLPHQSGNTEVVIRDGKKYVAK